MSLDTIPGHYDWRLVTLSLAIAISAAYTAIDLAGRTADARGRYKALWITAGAIALGQGIWAMHYIGMLALEMPDDVLYSIPSVGLSLVAAIVSSAVALYVVSFNKLSRVSLWMGSVAMGGGIAAMHYTGMSAMRMHEQPVYNPWLVVLSLVIAVAVSYLALHQTFRLRAVDETPLQSRLACAVMMGVAIAAMHYTGMAAASFHHMMPARLPSPASIKSAVAISSLGVAGIASATFSILALTLLSTLADRKYSMRGHLLRSEQERFALLMGGSQACFIDYNLVSGVVYRSPGWNSMLGYALDGLEANYKAWTEILHPDDRPRVIDEQKSYLQNGCDSYETEYRIRHKQGHYLWIFAHYQAVWDEQRQPLRLLGSLSNITERKEAVAALEVSEARFAAFMEHNPSMAYIKDEAGRLLYANSTAEKVWRLKPGQWLGKTGHEVWPPDLAARSERSDKEVLSTGSPAQVLETLRTPDGVLRHFLVSKFSFPELSGRRVLGGLVMDITERIQAEEKLRTSESRYRQLFEQNPLPSWIYSVGTLRILDVNNAAIEHYGWPRAEFLRLTVADIRMPGEVEMVEAEMRLSAAERKTTKTIRHRRNNRSTIWVELSSDEVEVGGINARLVMAHDITARIEAEERIKHANEQLEALVNERTADLQKSEAAWRGLVEALPQFVWSTTAEGVCSYISSPWAEYSGVATQDLLGSGWLNTLHPDDQVLVKACDEEARSKGIPFDFEYRIRSKDGNYRWFMSRGRPVRAIAGGPVTQWLGTSTDIDDQKRSAERLECAVAERTRDLAEARDRAESAARAKSEFLAVMSHEIRTPLNGVMGLTHLMLDTPLNEVQRGYLDSIHLAGQSLYSIINDILDFSKIEMGKLQLENTAFRIRSVVDQSLELISASAAKKNLDISQNVGDDVPELVSGDSGRLRQVLLNLLSNAVKFTESGSVKVLLSAEHAISREEDSEARVYVRFEVTDSGIGLTPEQQAGLFQPFVQADPSTTRRFGGTGLGLSIAKRLVERMSGRIGVISQMGQGTTFWFTVCLGLPQATSACSLSALPLNEPAPQLKGRFLSRPARILVADDNITNQQVAVGMLQQFGLNADAVSDGAEALAALQNIAYDLVLMDVRMPNMDGLEATRRIRSSEILSHKRLPVIALTASAMPVHITAFMEAGMDEYVSKPVSPEALAVALDRWLPTQGHSGELAPVPPPERNASRPTTFDVPSMLGRCMGSESLLERVLDGFLSDMPRQIESLLRLVEQGDLAGIQSQAHKLKGAAANVSGEALRAVASDMELACSAGKLEQAQARMPEVHAEFELLKQAIAAHFQKREVAISS